MHHSKNWVAHVRFGSIGACRRDVRFTPKSAHETDTGRVQRASSLLGRSVPEFRNSSMSALPPKADIGTQSRNVRFVPKADKVQRSKQRLFDHLVGAGRLASEDRSVCAALRLMISLKVAGLFLRLSHFADFWVD